MKILQKKATQILLTIIITLFVVFLIMLFSRGEKAIGPDMGLSVTWTEGNVLFSGNGEIWEVADNDTLLPNSYRLRTGKGSRAILNTPKGSHIRLDENTEIQVAQISKQDVLLVQNSGRTYHRVKMANEDIYQVRALNHTVKSVGTAFDISTNRKANRINAKVLEGKLNLAISLGEIIEVQSIGKGREITIDPEGKNIVTLADISREYAKSDWTSWNRQEDMKIGYILSVVEDLLAEDEDVEEEVEITTPKTTSTTPTKTTPPPTTTPPVSTGECKPYLTGKKEMSYKGILLNWSTCSNDNFQFYKVIRSTINPNPSYPNDPVVASSSNRSYSNYIDKTVAPTRTYNYRVCAVQRLNKISCGNTISVTY